MRKLVVLSIVLTLVAAACGSGDDDTLGADGRELDRCSLMKAEEAAEWLGGPVSAAPSEDLDGNPDPVTCYYQGANASVLLQVRDGAVYFAEPGSASRIGEDVEGIGEDAFMDSDSIEVLQDDWSVAIGLISGLIPDDALIGMAEIVSGRLP